MKSIITTAVAVLVAVPAMATPHGSAPVTATSSTNVNVDQNYQPPAPSITGPVPRGYVPVLSVYGQLDGYQRPVYGAQISIPLAR